MPSKPSFEDAVAAVADGDTPNLRQLSQFVEAAGTITDSANAIVTALDDTSPLAIDWDETNELRGAIRTQAREKIWERAVEAAQALRDAVSDFVAEVRGALAEPEPEEVEQPESECHRAGSSSARGGAPVARSAVRPSTRPGTATVLLEALEVHRKQRNLGKLAWAMWWRGLARPELAARKQLTAFVHKLTGRERRLVSAEGDLTEEQRTRWTERGRPGSPSRSGACVDESELTALTRWRRSFSK